MNESTELLEGLHIGSKPRLGSSVARKGFTVLVLCAEEYQPRSSMFPGVQHVIHVPLDDAVPTNREIDAAVCGAMEVTRLYESGENILVTCMQGRNRSGLVCAMAISMITGWSPETAANYVRSARVGPDGGRALDNPHFLALLGRIKAAS